jgi:hypothetical protein
MCKKTLWNFLRYYYFLFGSSKKEFDCNDSKKNEFYYKNTYAGYELLLGVLLGVSMAISSYIYDVEFIPLLIFNGVTMLVSSMSIALYHWFKYI